MNYYCSECERPIGGPEEVCPIHIFAPTDSTPGELEEPLSEVDALDEPTLEFDADDPIPFCLTPLALETR